MKSSKHKIIISALSAVFYLAYSFLLRHQVSNVFTTDISNQNIRLLSVFLSCIFGYCVFFLIFTALYLFIQKNNCFLSYLKQFLLYFIPLFILLILTWPGIFKGDDFYVLNAIRDYSLSPAQTGLTSLFYICCIRFFPSMGSIAFFQIIIISCIYASRSSIFHCTCRFFSSACFRRLSVYIKSHPCRFSLFTYFSILPVYMEETNDSY